MAIWRRTKLSVGRNFHDYEAVCLPSWRPGTVLGNRNRKAKKTNLSLRLATEDWAAAYGEFSISRSIGTDKHQPENTGIAASCLRSHNLPKGYTTNASWISRVRVWDATILQGAGRQAANREGRKAAQSGKGCRPADSFRPGASPAATCSMSGCSALIRMQAAKCSGLTSTRTGATSLQA